MYDNPTLVQALARDRAAELRRAAEAAALGKGDHRQQRRIEAARRGAGWLLVDMGLRLAVPRHALSHPVARVQR
jgi:hypothetical protein